MPDGKSSRAVANDAASAGRDADEAQRFGCFGRDLAHALEAGLNRQRIPQRFGSAPWSPRALRPGDRASSRHAADRGPRPLRPGEPACGQSGCRRATPRRLDNRRADGRKRRSSAGMPRRWPARQITRVIRQAFQLEARCRAGDSARGGSEHSVSISKRLAIGGGMADRGVAGHGFHRVDRALVRSADERTLDAAVLVAERDFQMKHALRRGIESGNVQARSRPRVPGPRRLREFHRRRCESNP